MSTFDWTAIHRRLELATAFVAEGQERDPEKIRDLLQARARAAARPSLETAEEERLELLFFSLAGESYAVETRYLREVAQLQQLTTLPGVPPFLAGVIHLRGRVLAILDLRPVFELPNRGLTELNQVIVLAEGENEFGLLADSIQGLGPLAASELQSGLPTLKGVRKKFLKGITAEMLTVLDGGRLLSDPALKVNQKESRYTRGERKL